MAVEYHASTMANMEVDNSKVGYRQLMDEGSKLRYSVTALRNSPFRVAACLGLLCVLLLAGVIGQSIHYRKVEQEHQNNLTSMSNEKEKLQQNLKMVQSDKKNLENVRNQLQQRNDVLSKKNTQIQSNYNSLSQEQQQLRSSKTQLQTSNAAFTKEIQELKASKDQLQTNYDTVSNARTVLQKQHDIVVKRKTELQGNYETMTKDRDNLQNKFNNVTRAKDRLQSSYNDLIKRVEHLQDRYNFSNSEKDKLKSSHQNLTISKDALEENYNTLKEATDNLRAAYSTLAQEKTDLDNNCKNATVERDLLKATNDKLTAERDALQVELERLKTVVPVSAKKCPTGWMKFQYSCYFASVSKNTWNLSRAYCQNNGADLAIITSEEEMQFINTLTANTQEAWIGLSDEGIEGHWTWIDGTTLVTAYWGKDQPNSHKGKEQDCVEFWHRSTGRGDWNDEDCSVEEAYICEK